MPCKFNTGAIYKGLISSRRKDLSILGLIHGNFSSDYADTIRATGAGRAGHEAVIEAASRFQLTKSAYIQPDV